MKRVGRDEGADDYPGLWAKRDALRIRVAGPCGVSNSPDPGETRKVRERSSLTAKPTCRSVASRKSLPSQGGQARRSVRGLLPV